MHGAFAEGRDRSGSLAIIIEGKIGGAQHGPRHGVGGIAGQDLRKSADAFLIILHAKCGDAEVAEQSGDGGIPAFGLLIMSEGRRKVVANGLGCGKVIETCSPGLSRSRFSSETARFLGFLGEAGARQNCGIERQRGIHGLRRKSTWLIFLTVEKRNHRSR